MASTVKQYAGDMAGRAKDKGRTLFEQQKGTALDQVGKVAQAIRSTAGNLQESGQDQTARYVHMIADQLESLGGRLGEKDLDTLMRDAQNLARRAPGTLLLGSVVTGFLVARFLKTSSERQYGHRDMMNQERRVVAAGEAGPYVGAAETSRTTGTHSTSGTSVGTAGTGVTPSGLNGQNTGGNRL
jgi:hypothetical protein